MDLQSSMRQHVTAFRDAHRHSRLAALHFTPRARVSDEIPGVLTASAQTILRGRPRYVICACVQRVCLCINFSNFPLAMDTITSHIHTITKEDMPSITVFEWPQSDSESVEGPGSARGSTKKPRNRITIESVSICSSAESFVLNNDTPNDNKECNEDSLAREKDNHVSIDPSRLSLLDKSEELVSFARAWLYSKNTRRKTTGKPMSAYGKFVDQTVEPLYEWYGRNKRVVTTPALCNIGLQLQQDGRQQTLLNGSSFNYAGAYAMPPQYEALQHKCLDNLPYANTKRVDFMYRTMLDELAGFMRVDCAFATATGYTSNMALAAIVDDSWAVLMDEKAHNSMFTGCYLADAGSKSIWPLNESQSFGRISTRDREFQRSERWKQHADAFTVYSRAKEIPTQQHGCTRSAIKSRDQAECDGRNRRLVQV